MPLSTRPPPPPPPPPCSVSLIAIIWCALTMESLTEQLTVAIPQWANNLKISDHEGNIKPDCSAAWIEEEILQLSKVTDSAAYYSNHHHRNSVFNYLIFFFTHLFIHFINQGKEDSASFLGLRKKTFVWNWGCATAKIARWHGKQVSGWLISCKEIGLIGFLLVRERTKMVFIPQVVAELAFAWLLSSGLDWPLVFLCLQLWGKWLKTLLVTELFLDGREKKSYYVSWFTSSSHSFADISPKTSAVADQFDMSLPTTWCGGWWNLFRMRQQ